ncbi:MAG: ribonucleoside-diphosphate reductase subunit alpha [Candidatus Marsarchaeota archaeon]|nr:ribonucleoside-diphosphate reductase subunit alpha [Candidatus Marsarchaeota archaeon]
MGGGSDSGFDTVKKRDGTIVKFDAVKITSAIQRALTATRGSAGSVDLDELTKHVIEGVNARYSGYKTPDVEGVQDIVERTLMEFGLYDVARAYILYRERHREMRENQKNETIQKIRSGMISVKRQDGSTEPFDDREFRGYIKKACIGYEGVVDVENLAMQCEMGIYDGISTKDVSKLAILSARALIERDPAYSTVTTRLFLFDIYRDVLGTYDRDLDGSYRKAFSSTIAKGVRQGTLAREMENFDMGVLSTALHIDRDEMLAYRGLQTLYDRYFMRDKDTDSPIETPQFFWMRVAMGLAINETDREKRAIEFYEVLSSLRFVSSTPTLFHSGTMHPQLSSCYLTTVEDDLGHIFKAIGDNAQLSKWSGGLGNDWSNLRATGALIKTTNVESQGVIPFLKIANDTTVAINRSGKRRGATCAYLEVWHMDIEDFIDLRRTTGDERRRTQDMDTAAWIPDLFMKRVIDDRDWTLFSPDETPDLHHIYGKKFEDKYIEYEKQVKEGKIRLYKTVKAAALWRKLITSLFETSHPWLVFKDPANVRSPQDHVGVVHSSNLCTEITLNTSKDETAVCNLGSVNLARHVKNGSLDVELLKQTVTTAMRMLDNVVDINYYPTTEAKNSNMKHRPVGLGIMGYQDALYLLNLNFDSEEAVRFADESMEAVSYYAILASSELARERGAYASFSGSKWDRRLLPLDTLDMLEKERGVKIDVERASKMDWLAVRESIKANGMRNSNCMAIAPTATISNIADCYPSIEPIYKNIYVKSNMSGEFTVVNAYLVEDLKALGLWNKTMLAKIKEHDGNIQHIESIPKRLKDKYKEAFDIEPEWLIKAAAYRLKWIDQSQSLNIFTATNSGKRLSDIYTYAWRMGLKSTYYLRTMAATSIEKSTLEITNKAKTVDVGSGTGKVVLQVEQAAAVEREGTEVQEAATAQQQPQQAVPGSMTEEGKACKITGNPMDDPNCEACQ